MEISWLFHNCKLIFHNGHLNVAFYRFIIFYRLFLTIYFILYSYRSQFWLSFLICTPLYLTIVTFSIKFYLKLTITFSFTQRWKLAIIDFVYFQTPILNSPWNLSICIAFIQYLARDGKGNGWRPPPHVHQIDRDIITARLQLISMAQMRGHLINVSLWKGQNCLLKLSPSQTPLIICAGYLLPLSAWWVPFISG